MALAPYASWHTIALGAALTAPISMAVPGDELAAAEVAKPLQLVLEFQLRPHPEVRVTAIALPGRMQVEIAILRLRLDEDVASPGQAPKRTLPGLAASGGTGAGGSAAHTREPLHVSTPSPTAPTTPSPLPTPFGSDEALALVLLEMRIKWQEPGKTVLMLEDRNGGLLASADDLKRWRLPAPEDAPARRDGIAYHRLVALAGSRHRFDLASQWLEIELNAGRLAPTYLAATPYDGPAPVPSPLGGFINYDLTAGSDSGVRQIAGFFEVGAFGAWGNGTTTFLANRQQGSAGHVVRLESTINRDFSATLESMRVGDATVRAGAFALGYTAQHWRDQPDTRLISANFSRQLGTLGALGISLLRVMGPQGGTIISANLTVPFEGSRSASFSKTVQPGLSGTTFQLQHNAPVGSGVGYRLQADSAGGGRQQGMVTVQAESGTASLEAAWASDQFSLRASVSGGVAFIGGSVFPARRINESFAVVDVPGYVGVRIFAENHAVATTGPGGRALVPNLRAYQANRLRIDGADLPMNVSIDSVSVDAVPYARSGLLLQFPVRRSDGGVIRVLLDDGDVVPSGAVARIEGRDELMPAGQRGEIYLTELSAENQVAIMWNGRRCDVSVPFRPSADPLPELGTCKCKGVTR